MPIATIKYINGKVRIIDQTKLPQRLLYAEIKDVQSMWQAIKELKIRGAPLIGVAGAFEVLLGIKNINAKNYKEFKKGLDSVIGYLASIRPTGRNLFWALERMRNCAEENAKKSLPDIKEALLKEAFKIMKEDQKVCRRIARFGAKLIKNGDSILTHCNTGRLATVDYGTALGVIFKAKEEAKQIKVFVNETRPLLQGARLSTWELLREKIDVTLICDNMAAHFMKKGKITKIFVGSDRIAKNGDVANKIGTYNLAIIAHYHNIPFYVVAPLSTFDFKISSGDGIPIEERDKDEVIKVLGKRIAPEKVKVCNPAFDITPAHLITAIVTEIGIIEPPFSKMIKKLKYKMETKLI